MKNRCSRLMLGRAWLPQEANLSDVLMDRAVMVDSNLRNAVLQRAIFTR